MKRVVTFIDTSVLVEVLKVPGKSQRHEEVAEELRRRVGAGASMVLPAAAVIETGNHIAQLPNGADRHRVAQGFERLLRQTIDGTAPWRVNGASWDGELLEAICSGAWGSPALPQMAVEGIGAGDLSILAEAEAYARGTAHVDVRIWTLESSLRSYAPG